MFATFQQLQEVFGVSSAAQVNVESPALEPRENPMSKRVREIIDLLNEGRAR